MVESKYSLITLTKAFCAGILVLIGKNGHLRMGESVHVCIVECGGGKKPQAFHQLCLGRDAEQKQKS